MINLEENDKGYRRCLLLFFSELQALSCSVIFDDASQLCAIVIFFGDFLLSDFMNRILFTNFMNRILFTDFMNSKFLQPRQSNTRIDSIKVQTAKNQNGEILQLGLGHWVGGSTKMGRGGNRAGRVRFGFGSDGSGQFDLLKEIESGRSRIGSIYMLCFFKFLIDFDLIEVHLISGQIRSDLDRILI
jgi:hypothetical protein